MTNSKVQNDMRVQDTFKQLEVAQLCLVQKTPKNTIITEAETKAIRPKAGRGAKGPTTSSDKKVVDDDRGKLDKPDFHEELVKVPGLHHFLTTRDENVREHLGDPPQTFGVYGRG